MTLATLDVDVLWHNHPKTHVTHTLFLPEQTYTLHILQYTCKRELTLILNQTHTRYEMAGEVDNVTEGCQVIVLKVIQ